MQTLSRREEDAIFKEVKQKAVLSCDNILKDFATCSQGRTISVTWACRDQWKAMQKCMKSEMNEEALDRAKLQYLETRRNAAVPSGP